MTQTYPLKARILAQDNGPTRVDVYDDIGDGIFTSGLTAKNFTAQLRDVKGALEVHVNSSGGDVFDGISIGNAIRAHKGPVKTIVDGLAASIASVIAQAGQERVVQPGSMLMIHDAFGACVGNASEMAKMSQTLDQVSDNIAEIYASRGGGTQQSWRDAMREETWYTAEEAVAAGLADRVGDGEAELPAGLDLAAFQAVPGRIAARLRAMPQAKAPVIVDADGNHAPMSGSHAHGHPAYGSQGNDSSHSHDHSHDGDANHRHSHATADATRQDIRGDATGPCCSMCGPDCACTAQPAAHGHDIAAASYMHGDHVRVDPDGDGDCDACPEGDTDHDYWDEDGNQIKPLPGGSGNALAEMIRAIVREELINTDKYKQADRDRMAKSGEAMPDGSYPIADEEDLNNAIHAVGRGGADHDAIRKHIIKRAKALGLSERIPDNWNADGSLGDDDAGNHAPYDISGIDLEQIRSALKGATA